MRSLRRIAFGVLVAAVVGLAALNILVWQGALVDEEPEPAASPRPTRSVPKRRTPPPPPPVTTTTRRAPTQPPSAQSALSTIVLTAARGDCWVVARSESATGPVLYEGLLRQATSTRLRAKRLWLSLGAAANVDVLIDGKPEQLPAGTIELVVPREQSSS
jgi:hypothetical protein